MAGVYGPSVVSVEAAAAAFLPHADGCSQAEVAGFLSQLGGIGPGLHSLLQSTPAAGPLFRAVYHLGMLADMAVVNKANCQRVAFLGQETLTILDAAGRRGARLRDIGLEAMTACFEDICNMVDAFAQSGWLLRLACDGQLKEEFETLHQAVIELLKGEGVVGLPGVRSPPPPDYKDVTKPLRRMLKQLGSGSLSRGVQVLRKGGRSCAEVARLLGVKPETLIAEAGQVPDSDMDLDTVFHQLMQPTSLLQRLGGGGPATTTTATATMASSNAIAGAVAASCGGAASTSGGGAGGSFGAAGAGGAAASRESAGGIGSMSASDPAGLYADLFRWYDKNRSGALEREEFMGVLADLGMLEGRSPAQARELLDNHLRMADAGAAARGEGVAFGPFCKFYSTLVLHKARQQLRFKMGLQVEEDLRTTFVSFASFGSRESLMEMDGAHFMKLCRDCSLLDRTTTTTDADIIFAAVKTKGMRRVTFEQFITALAKLAERKGTAFEDVVNQVLQAGGPVANATHADNVRLHDDKSSYCGVYARGGPSPCDQAPLELALMLDRSLPESARRLPSPRHSPVSSPRLASMRKSRVNTVGGHATAAAAAAGSTSTPGTPAYSSLSLSRTSSVGGTATTPFGGIRASATPPTGRPVSSSSSSRRVSRSAAADATGATSRRLSRDAATPAVSTGGRRTSRDAGTPGSAASWRMSAGMLPPSGALSTPPQGTLPSNLKEVFTAFAGFGIRSPAGWAVTPASGAGQQVGAAFGTSPSSGGGGFSFGHIGGGSAGGAGGGGAGSRGGSLAAPNVLKPLMKEMDSFRFVKLCREAGLFDAAFNSISADIIFAKVKSKGAKKITYAQFSTALDLIAAEKRTTRQALDAALLASGGPAVNSSSTVTPALDLLRLQDNAGAAW